MNNSNLKIAIVHDHLGFCGGGERTVMILALELGADFITAYANAHTFPEYQEKLNGRLKCLTDNIVSTRVIRFFWLRWLFYKNRNIFKQYDVLIASSQAATEAVGFYAKPKALKIVYTHTTPRRIFDMYEISKAAYPVFLRLPYALFTRFWKFLYQEAINRIDINIANSKNIRQRIRDHVKTNANYVVWPPIIADKFKFIESGDYFLSYGRLDEAKRIELIAEAFKEMPDKKLIIASGGPRFNQVKEITEGCENIKVLGWVCDEKLFELVGRARAVIYIPLDEDAGMTHLESNAAGKPYLGVKEGGLIESTIVGETGILLPANPNKDDIVSGVREMTAEWCFGKKDKCIVHAQKYRDEYFLAKMKKIIIDNDPNIPIIGIDASRWEHPGFPGEGIRTGVEMYSMNMVKALIEIAQEKKMRVRVYTPRLIQSLPPEIQKIIPYSAGWTANKLSKELKHSPVDYFFTPSYYIPKYAPEKSYAVIHDVIFKSDPERYSLRERVNQDLVAKLNFKRAEKIFTVSEYSKKEIKKYYGVADDKIISVPMGYEPHSSCHSRVGGNPGSVARNWIPAYAGMTEKVDFVKNKIILYIGRVEKKKSVDILVQAFREFSRSHDDWKLVLAGRAGHGADDIRRMIADYGLTEKIFLSGYISEENKWKLFSQSGIFVHPSQHEGSSLPLLEAMDAGIPAIVSDIEVMRELGQDATIYFKPGDFMDLAKQILFVARHPEVAEANVLKGRELLKERSWEKSAGVIINELLK